MRLATTILLAPLVGCIPNRVGPGIGGSPLSGIATGHCDPATGSLAILSWTGGISILAGMACLIITSGRMGLRGLIGGVLLVLINYAINKFAHAIFIPMIVGTGLISLSWSYVQIKRVWGVKRSATSPVPSPVVNGSHRGWSFWRNK